MEIDKNTYHIANNLFETELKKLMRVYNLHVKPEEKIAAQDLLLSQEQCLKEIRQLQKIQTSCCGNYFKYGLSLASFEAIKIALDKLFGFLMPDTLQQGSFCLIGLITDTYLPSLMQISLYLGQILMVQLARFFIERILQHDNIAEMASLNETLDTVSESQKKLHDRFFNTQDKIILILLATPAEHLQLLLPFLVSYKKHIFAGFINLLEKINSRQDKLFFVQRALNTNYSLYHLFSCQRNYVGQFFQSVFNSETSTLSKIRDLKQQLEIIDPENSFDSSFILLNKH